MDEHPLSCRAQPPRGSLVVVNDIRTAFHGIEVARRAQLQSLVDPTEEIKRPLTIENDTKA
jgi:hypothetical protein